MCLGGGGRFWVYQGDGLGQTLQLQSQQLRLVELSWERQELFRTVPVLLPRAGLWQTVRPLLDTEEEWGGGGGVRKF